MICPSGRMANGATRPLFDAMPDGVGKSDFFKLAKPVWSAMSTSPESNFELSWT